MHSLELHNYVISNKILYQVVHVKKILLTYSFTTCHNIDFFWLFLKWQNLSKCRNQSDFDTWVDWTTDTISLLVGQ
jgi:hypothetical protein